MRSSATHRTIERLPTPWSSASKTGASAAGSPRETSARTRLVGVDSAGNRRMCRLHPDPVAELERFAASRTRVHIAQAVPGKLVIPFRVEPVEPKGALRYLLSGLHWLDATDRTARARSTNCSNASAGRRPAANPGAAAAHEGNRCAEQYSGGSQRVRRTRERARIAKERPAKPPVVSLVGTAA